MQHLELPWIDNQDPFIDYYGLISELELQFIRKNFTILSGPNPVFNISGLDLNQYSLLLDFSDYYNDNGQFLLYNDLCNILTTNHLLYWMPLDNHQDEFLFECYKPRMIAKTPCDNKILKKASLSFMQMQNGGFFLMEANEVFFAIIVDGYYMIALVNKNYNIENINNYVINWSIFKDKLDANCSNILFDFFNKCKQILY